MSSESRSHHPLSVDIVERARRGDDSAWRELTEGLLGHVKACIRIKCGVRLPAHISVSDVTQSALREALKGLPTFEDRGPEAFRGFLITLVMRKVTAYLRKHGAAKRGAGTIVALDTEYMNAGSQLVDPADAVLRREDLERLEAALGQLDEQKRTAVYLSHFENLPYSVVAECLGCTEEAARKQCARGKARLRALMKEGP